MKKILSIISFAIGIFSFAAERVQAQDNSIGLPSERVWFQWLWLFPLLALTALLLLPQEGGDDGRRDEEIDQMVGSKGGQSSTSDAEDEAEDVAEVDNEDEQ